LVKDDFDRFFYSYLTAKDGVDWIDPTDICLFLHNNKDFGNTNFDKFFQLDIVKLHIKKKDHDYFSEE